MPKPTRLEEVPANAMAGIRQARDALAAGKRPVVVVVEADHARRDLVADALAAEFQLALVRVDLSTVASKSIGETEKNLRKRFDAAEAGGSILFLDEADALFGKRTEVKDSHDRYADLEAGDLLHGIESYPGLVVLATNRKQDIDAAFLRRLRHVMELPLPRPRMERQEG